MTGKPNLPGIYLGSSLQIRARSAATTWPPRSTRAPESQDHIVNRHTVIAAAGSTAGLTDIATATAHLIKEQLGATT